MDPVLKMYLNKKNLKKYNAIVSQMHSDLYRTAGEGTFGDRLGRVLQLKPLNEVFAVDDENRLPPEAVLCLYKEWTDSEESYYSCYLRKIGGETKKVVEFLDFLDDLDVSIACEDMLIKYNGALRSDILDHPYWDRRLGQLLEYLGEISSDSKSARQIRERINLAPSKQPGPPVPLKDKTIADIVAECQQKGDISPLQKIVQNLEKHSANLTGNVLRDVGVAFRDLKGTFWEVRELVNAIQPGTYPYPLQKSEPEPVFTMGWLKQVFQGQNQTTEKNPRREAVHQYRASLGRTAKNVEKLDQAIASLYALNRQGGERAEAIGDFVTSIQDYIDSDSGQKLQSEDKILFDYLQATQHGLAGSRTSLNFVQSLSEGLASRAIPLKQTLSATLNSMNVTMALQTAKSVISHEGYKDNFLGSIKHMAAISKGITTDFAINAGSLNDTGATLAADLLADAIDIQETIANYHEQLTKSGDPTTSIMPS